MDSGEMTENEVLENNQVLVLMVPEDAYTDQIVKLVKELEKKSDRICYITLNRPYKSVKDVFINNGIDITKFFVIDAISKTAEVLDDTKNCKYVSSPGALTELRLEISEVIETQKFDYILFDSLSTLMVYGKDKTITKFVHLLIAKCRSVGCKAIFTYLKQDPNTSLLHDVKMFADRVIDLEKWGLHKPRK